MGFGKHHRFLLLNLVTFNTPQTKMPRKAWHFVAQEQQGKLSNEFAVWVHNIFLSGATIKVGVAFGRLI